MKRTPMRHKPPADHRSEPGYRAWHEPVSGECSVCGARGLLLRHHVVLEQHVRAAGGDPWDLRNALQLGYHACACHRDHHHAVRRIALSKVSAEALGFAVELLGEDAAGEYLVRYYRIA